ncbi:MAG TPA: response regulator transcription factor [Gammaproteobacteria bacterium]|nr:response regulator transcription factor [Gammaproteobacteria bacterium]
MNATRRIVIADDHAIVRAGYCALLSRHPGCTIVGEAADGAEAYRLVASLAPDLLVIDLSMPGLGGLGAIPRVRQRRPDCRVLVLSMHGDPAYVERALLAGAHGYVTKSSAPDILLAAVDAVAGGGRYLSPDLSSRLAWQRLGSAVPGAEDLTPREFEVLRLLVEAHTPAAIARALGISDKTVLNMHYTIKRKLQARTDIELMHAALRMGLIDAPPQSPPAPAED